MSFNFSSRIQFTGIQLVNIEFLIKINYLQPDLISNPDYIKSKCKINVNKGSCIFVFLQSNMETTTTTY